MRVCVWQKSANMGKGGVYIWAEWAMRAILYMDETDYLRLNLLWELVPEEFVNVCEPRAADDPMTLCIHSKNKVYD